MCDLRRVDVAEAAARQPRLQGIEPVAGHVERIQPTGVAHRRAECQRLAAGAGAEIDHHLAALGIGEQRQQLAAFVLHLDIAAREQLQLVQRRLALHAQAPGRIRCRLGRDVGRGQCGLHLIALGFQRIDAQIERRGFIEARRQRPEGVVAQRLLQRRGQPVGQVVAQLRREAAAVDAAQLSQPLLLVRPERTAQHRLAALPAEDGQTPLERAMPALREMLEEQPLAKHGVGRFRERVALARAEVAVLAEEGGDDTVGR